MDGTGSDSAAANRNIETVLRREEADWHGRPSSHKFVEALARAAGTLRFVAAQAAFIAGWVAVNLGVVPGLTPFDPFPFGMLGTAFSIEGVLLATFVLMQQNRMSARSEERSHLDLQISLLSEQEVTKVIQMLDRISVELGIGAKVVDAETREFSENTAVHDIAEELQDRLRQSDAP